MIYFLQISRMSPVACVIPNRSASTSLDFPQSIQTRARCCSPVSFPGKIPIKLWRGHPPRTNTLCTLPGLDTVGLQVILMWGNRRL